MKGAGRTCTEERNNMWLQKTITRDYSLSSLTVTRCALHTLITLRTS